MKAILDPLLFVVFALAPFIASLVSVLLVVLFLVCLFRLGDKVWNWLERLFPVLLLCGFASSVCAQAPVPVTPENSLTNRTVSQPLTWNPPTNYVNPFAPLPLSDIAGYRLYRSPIPGVFTNDVVLLLGGSSTNYTWRGLQPGSANYFAVVALNKDGVPSDASPVYLRQTAPLIASPVQIIPLTNTITASNGRLVRRDVYYVEAVQPVEMFQSRLEWGTPTTAMR